MHDIVNDGDLVEGFMLTEKSLTKLMGYKEWVPRAILFQSSALKVL